MRRVLRWVSGRLDPGSEARVTSAVVRKAAAEVIGDVEFRPGQAEAIEAVLERDTLAVLASGTGKTLVYTVAARLIDGGTLVVSPTIALQHDQLRTLESTHQTAALLNGTVPAGQRAQALADFAAGKIEFLLLAPEQLANDDVLARLREAHVSLLVVDEAHCISEWGQSLHESKTAGTSARRRCRCLRTAPLSRPAPRSCKGPWRCRCCQGWRVRHRVSDAGGGLDGAGADDRDNRAAQRG